MTEYNQIRSVEDPDSTHPWYDLDISNLPPRIKSDNDGGTKTDTSGQSVSAIGDIDPDDPSKSCVYAVTNSGQYICYPQGRDLSHDSISLRAHLAWYDADADEFTVLEFVE